MYKSPCYDRYVFAAPYTTVAFVIFSLYSSLIAFYYIALLKVVGIIPTLVLLSIWKVSRSPYCVSKYYECFNAFNFSCMQLDQNTYEGLIGERRINFIGF